MHVHLIFSDSCFLEFSPSMWATMPLVPHPSESPPPLPTHTPPFAMLRNPYCTLWWPPLFPLSSPSAVRKFHSSEAAHPSTRTLSRPLISHAYNCACHSTPGHRVSTLSSLRRHSYGKSAEKFQHSGSQSSDFCYRKSERAPDTHPNPYSPHSTKYIPPLLP